MTDDENESPSQKLWSIGAVSQRTGLSEHTLRAWEKRFGFPDPVRLRSGHRRYPSDQVSRLTAIQSALVRGHRIGDVIDRDESEILALLSSDAESSPPRDEGAANSYMEASTRLDADGLRGALRQDVVSLGISRFLDQKLIPFVRALGEGWRDGTLSIRHEHVSSEVVEDVLRELRTQLERGLSGRPVILGTLPGEQHALGLQIVALKAVARGIPVRLLGTEIPVEEIVTSAIELDPVAVALSLTEAGITMVTESDMRALRQALPPDVPLWIGGAGARKLRNLGKPVRIALDHDDIDEFLAEVHN